MRFLPIILSLCLASVDAFSQDDPPKYAYLEMSEMKQMVVARDFRDVPSEVRDVHAQGYLVLKVKIDLTGQPVRVFAFKNSVVGKYDSVREYTGKAVSNWTFKPLLIDGKPSRYQGYVLIGFWYGAFLETVPANTSGPSDLPRSTKR